MALKTLWAPHLKHTVKMGRKRPKSGGWRVHLKDFLPPKEQWKDLGLTPPTSCDFTGPAAVPLADIYENDQLGDCVIAGSYHTLAIITGNGDPGVAFHATSEQITADYSAIGGYVPGNAATDQGCDELTALEHYRTVGYADGSQLTGYLTIDATDLDEVKLAAWLFENLMFGVELPDAWINPFPSGPGFTWDVNGSPDPSNGHCFVATGYRTAGDGSLLVDIDTWGLLGEITAAAVAMYAGASGGGELHVAFSPEQLAKAATKAPNGVDWASIQQAFDEIGGGPSPDPAPPAPPAPPEPPNPNPAPPAPPPAPSPPEPPPAPPTPAGGVTLSQAIDWAIAGLQGQDVWTTYDAIDSVVTGLAVNWPSDAPLGAKPKNGRVLRTFDRLHKAVISAMEKAAAAKAKAPKASPQRMTSPMLPPARPSRPQTGKGPFGR
jgi:hypothetical protein